MKCETLFSEIIFLENGVYHFMQIISRRHLHKMLNSVFHIEKKIYVYKKSSYFKMSYAVIFTQISIKVFVL